MPNQIGPNGATVKTFDELKTDKTTAYQTAYGVDIDLSSTSPDGQRIGNEIQTVLDQEDLALQVNSSFDADQCTGRTQDQRYALNGIERQGATFSTTFEDVTVDRALTLPGLDDQVNEPNPKGNIYTIQDDAGVSWYLTATQVIGAPGTGSFLFRAKDPGSITSIPNTITNPVTVVVGVTGLNNPTALETLGDPEESDADFRIRRRKSVSIGGTGYEDNVEAALENVPGVTTAIVHINTDDAADGDGTPGHTMWCIVSGGAPAEIAQAIYVKRSGGCGTRGAQSRTIIRRSGQPFIVRWDNVVLEDLYIQGTLTSIDGVTAVDPASIKAALVLLLTPGVFRGVNINELGTLIQEIDRNCLLVPTAGDGFSVAALGPFSNILEPTNKNNQFAVSAAHMTFVVV